MKRTASPNLWRPLRVTVFRNLLVAGSHFRRRRFHAERRCCMADGLTWRRADLCCAGSDCRFLAIFSTGPSCGLRWRYRRPTKADSLICWACCRPTTTPHSHTRPLHGRGRCSVAQTTGISVAAEFESFVRSDPGKRRWSFVFCEKLLGYFCDKDLRKFC